MVNPLSCFLFQPVLHDWCNKGCGMCYPVCGMVHIKEPLLLIGKSSPLAAAGFLFHETKIMVSTILSVSDVYKRYLPANRKE